MALLRSVLRVQWIFALFISAACCGCSLVDAQLSPRAYDINQGTQNLRESAILLNLVRASRSEPLNFVALSKYTGTGSLAVNDSLVRNQLERFGNPTSIATHGSFSTGLNAAAANSFDVGTLENRDFYGGFLSPLDLEGLNLLLNAGLTREVVFHSTMAAFRVTSTGGAAFLFRNNPEDDVWTEGGVKVAHSSACASLYDGTEEAFETVFIKPIWRPPHEHDCNYQKFLYFLRLAIRYGVNVQAVPLPQERVNRSEGGRRGRGAGERDRPYDDLPKAEYFVCYDPAVAQEYGLHPPINAPGACGSKNRTIGKTHEFQFRFQFPKPISEIAPVVRSPYAVFQFYGRLIAGEAASHVVLSNLSLRGSSAIPRERRLLTVTRQSLDCFARASYAGTDYCVPNENTRNTKEVFVLLNTLVALSTNRSALPVSPTFVLTP